MWLKKIITNEDKQKTLFFPPNHSALENSFEPLLETIEGADQFTTLQQADGAFSESSALSIELWNVYTYIYTYTPTCVYI